MRAGLFIAALAAGSVLSLPASADIVVYTAGPAGLIRALSKGFTTESGIKVKVYQATTGKVMARMESEAANPSRRCSDLRLLGHGNRFRQARLAARLYQSEQQDGARIS